MILEDILICIKVRLVKRELSLTINRLCLLSLFEQNF